MKLFSVWKEFGMRKTGRKTISLARQKPSDPHSSQPDEQEMSDEKGSDDPKTEKGVASNT